MLYKEKYGNPGQGSVHVCNKGLHMVGVQIHSLRTNCASVISGELVMDDSDA
jgi:hypothetical protein